MPNFIPGIKSAARYIVDTAGRIAKFDPVTWVLMFVDYVHGEIHSKNAYLVEYSLLRDTDEFVEVRVETGATNKLPHMEIEIEGAIAGTAELWEDTTKTHVANNAITPFNRWRDPPTNTSLLTVCHTPGGSQTGDADLKKFFGASTTNQKVNLGGSASSRHEFVLKKNTAYLIKVTSRADANALTITLDWYEHTTRS